MNPLAVKEHLIASRARAGVDPVPRLVDPAAVAVARISERDDETHAGRLQFEPAQRTSDDLGHGRHVLAQCDTDQFANFDLIEPERVAERRGRPPREQNGADEPIVFPRAEPDDLRHGHPAAVVPAQHRVPRRGVTARRDDERRHTGSTVPDAPTRHSKPHDGQQIGVRSSRRLCAVSSGRNSGSVSSLATSSTV